MARAATPLPTFHCVSENRSALLSLPPSISLITANPRYSVCGSVSRFALASLSPWSGLKRLTISYQKNYSRRGSKEKCRGRVVYASLFGVGAPEVLVIGVVALLVFGPKGLAEVARNLGKTLRAFQPTIRELQEVSREFKSTLEREIGLDEVASPMNNAYKSTSVVDDTRKPSTSVANETPKPIVDPNGSPTTAEASTSEEVLKITEEQLVTASETGPQSETSNPQEQIQDSVATAVEVSGPEVAATPAAPEAASQAPTTEQAKNER